jgi:hypothetical protein
MKRLSLAFAIALLAASVASAKNFTITLFQPSVVGGTELKAGEYKLELDAGKVRISGRKQSGEAAVKVQNGDKKYESTSVKYGQGGRISEIRLGGTSTLLVFPEI